MNNNTHRHLNHNVERDQASSLAAAAELAPVEKITVINDVLAVTGLDVSCPTNGVSQNSNLDTPDAEASNGRIIVSHWNAIGENGVFAVTHISAGEVLGVLQGNIVRRRSLTRAERRRFIGVRVNGRATHLDLQGRWPEMINHAPPSHCNADLDADTWEIKVTKHILPGQQVLWDYGPGFWVDSLINRDYDKLPKHERSFFDAIHAVVDDYTWLIHALQQPRKLSVGLRIGVIAIYLSQLVSQAHFAAIYESSPNKAAKVTNGAVIVTSPLLQFLIDLGIDSYHRPVDELQKRDSSSLKYAI